jgi:hypothetical protein
MRPLSPVFALATALVVYVVNRLVKALVHNRRSPLRDLPGPPSASILYGNFLQIMSAEKHNSETFEEWVACYGDTFAMKGILNVSAFVFSSISSNLMLIVGPKLQKSTLITIDSKAVSHILKFNEIYYKPDGVRAILESLNDRGKSFSAPNQAPFCIGIYSRIGLR